MAQKVINDFSGGLSRQIAPHLIGDNQGTTYINIDNSRGTLTPIVRRDKDSDFDSLGLPVFLDSFEKWQGLPAIDSRPDYVEFRDEAYYLHPGQNTTTTGNLRFIPRSVAITALSTIGAGGARIGMDTDLTTLSIPLDQESLDPSDRWDLKNYARPRNISETDPADNPNTVFTDTTETFTYTFRSSRFQTESTPFPATRVEFTTDNQNLTFNNLQKLLDSRPAGFERISFYILVAGTYLRAFEIVGNDNLEGGPNRLAPALEPLPPEAATSELQQFARARQERTEIRVNNFEADAFDTDGNLNTDTQIVYTWFNPGAQVEPNLENTNNQTVFEIEGTALTTIGDVGAPLNIHSLTESGGRLYALQDQEEGGSRLYYSEVGRGYAWAALNFVTIPEKATALSRVYIRSDDQAGAGGLLVHSLNQTWLLTRSAVVLRPATENTAAVTTLSHSLVQVSANQGCVSSRSIQSINGTPFWVSRDGICVYAEGRVQLITKKISGYWNVRADHVLSSTVYNNAYYVLMSNGLTYIVDLDYAIHKQEMYGPDIGFITSGDNKLVGMASEASNEDRFSTPNRTLYNLDKRIGVANDTSIIPERAQMFFRSKQFNIGAFGVNQTFDSIYLSGEGVINLTVYINGVRAYPAPNASTEGTSVPVILTVEPRKIFLGHSSSRGSYIQFEFSGTGSIYDIRWDQDVSESEQFSTNIIRALQRLIKED